VTAAARNKWQIDRLPFFPAIDFRSLSLAARKAPWKRPNPRKKTGTAKKLSLSAKAAAKRSAKKAGRPYPNLVDNMRVAKKSKAKKRVKKPQGGSG
jgi:hypothetical protein